MNEPNKKLLTTTLTLVLGVGLLSSSAVAQDTAGGSTAGGSTTGGTTGGTTDTDRRTDDNGFDMGWLGLLGLAGLAGLRKKPDHIVHETRVTPPTTGTGPR